MSAPINRRRRSSISQFVHDIDAREKAHSPEPLGAIGSSAIPLSAGGIESLVRHVVANGLVPFTFGIALQKGRVFEPKVIQGAFC
jgi:hypothetical protein